MPTQNATPPDHQAVISRLKAVLKVREPFFGALALLTPVHYDPATSTAATDGMSIYVGDWFFEQSPNDQLFIITHELAHKALLHPFRQKANPATINPLRYNIAADYVVNALIHATPNLSWLGVPKEALYDRQYDGLSAEEVYKRLPSPPEAQPSDNGSDGSGQKNDSDGSSDSKPLQLSGDLRDPSSSSGQGETTNEAKVKAQILAAAKGSAPGTLPGVIASMVVALEKPKVDWKAVLREFLLAASPIIDTTWDRPSRRSYGAGVYLPSIKTPPGGLTQLFVLIDVSASCFDEAGTFLGELGGLLEAHPGCFEEVHIVFCDTRVVKHVQATSADLADNTSANPIQSLLKQIPAGGGTDLRAGIDFIKCLVQPNAKATALVVLTDGESPWPAPGNMPPAAATSRAAHMPTLVAIPERETHSLDPQTAQAIEAIAQMVDIPNA